MNTDTWYFGLPVMVEVDTRLLGMFMIVLALVLALQKGLR